MSFFYKIVLISLLILVAGNVQGQQGSIKKFSVSGYVKDLQILQFSKDMDPVFDNLIHQRANFRYDPLSQLSFGLDIRSRIYFGDSPGNPFFGDLLDFDPGIVDMSWLLVDKENWVFSLQIDRAWIDWTDKKWSVRAGRQRINWGINLYWNTNDLFNTNNIADFDYEELPGSDALRIQRHFKKMRSIEFAIEPSRDPDKWRAAILYKFNKKGYDFQTLLSWWNTDLAIGGGWAGNIRNAGFKGEMTYFIPRDGIDFKNDALSLSVSSDYFFKNSMYLTGGFMFNSTGTTETLISEEGLFFASSSAKNLMPTKYNFLINAAYPATPLIGVSALLIYAPGTELIYFIPSFSYSISQNWEFSMFFQTYWAEVDRVENLGNAFVLRFKMNY
ncbi:MAG: hypothetical protein HKN92_10990 [Chitinophagales bacterium]|nr:hypothetical protein [Chitinophagales bacterium]